MSETEPIFVKPARFAKLIDTSRANVYNLLARGKLRSVRIGGSIRIPIDELDRLLAEASAADER
jgi:excisionase family DNA binding protein